MRVLFDSAESESEDTIYDWKKKVSTYHLDKVCKNACVKKDVLFL